MRCELIAEVASNHGGDLDLAEDFIRAAADAGWDWVKFQSYQTKFLAPTDPQYEWLKQAELDEVAHERLIARCEREQIRFLTSVFDECRAEWLAEHPGVPALKVGSGQIFDGDLLRQCGYSRLFTNLQKLFISTGAATDEDVMRLSRQLGEETTFLHCVSEYPTPRTLVNLSRMARLRQLLNRPVGYSDHTVGLDVAGMAIAAGACVVEKHIQWPGRGRQQEWAVAVSAMRELRHWAEQVAIANDLTGAAEYVYRNRWAFRPAQ